ncbi:biopolymer transporter ExbD [Sandaracinobacter sp. RS1-74]|uniref:ExbD/TolR family protein n=1 Tax=Sandaracinobacteroides sayramensis TaxID=2913411 RepID=UPI001EDC02F6|nr:biopolymer transporter ExbD [Sandaracinobacteroides sayramensis]MCG2839428.1 biopolymer transporter ExbD [Sandaracinobacteroides sayramensis]
MAKVQDEDAIYDEINVVPMLDLAYVLIVIFILMATAQVAGIELDLPQASNRKTLEASQTQAISISAGGEVYLNGAPTTTPELEAEMRQRFAEDPDVPVVIRGDTKAAYGKVVEILDVLKGVGITKIGLPAEKPAS